MKIIPVMLVLGINLFYPIDSVAQINEAEMLSLINEFERKRFLKLLPHDTLFISVSEISSDSIKRYYVLDGKITLTNNETVCDSIKDLNRCLKIILGSGGKQSRIAFSLMNASYYSGSFKMEMENGKYIIRDIRYVQSSK